ncbi:TPA: hypothetical protein QCQ70_004251 [Bacillus cytotoxicus]|nr:hypothetical protein [Bacillus cytotoxicus]
MRKLLFLMALIFFCLTFSLVNSYQVQNENAKLLYKNKTKVYLDYKDDFNYKEFIDNMIAFSYKHNISIEQQVYTNEENLNVYHSNLNIFDKNLLKSGRIPSKDGKEFLSNIENNNKYQSGTLNIPSSTMNISVYSFNNLENSGIGNSLYISSTNADNERDTIEFLSNYARISSVEKVDIGTPITDIKLLISVSITFIFLLLSTIYFLELNVKKIGVLKLLGWDENHITFYYLKKILVSITCAAFVSLAAMLFYYFCKGTMIHVTSFLIISLVLTFIVLLLSSLLTISLLYFRIFEMQLNNILKGKENTKKLNIINSGSKIIITIMIFYFIGKTSMHIVNLNNELEQLKYWNSTKDIYSLSLTNIDPNNDLKLDKKINDRFLELYHQLDEKKQAFIIDATNFLVVPSKEEIKYSYQTHVKNEHDLYGIYGKSIIIDKNYLKVNPIKGVLSDNPLINLKSNSNTLNVLVPEKLRDKEEVIRTTLLNDFYFQKVEVKDIYNKDSNKPLESTTKESLNINIIYVKNNQKYFTYSADFGSPKENYKITDPIAIIFNDTVDTSFIKAYASKCLYFKDTSNEPYKSIEAYLDDSKTKSNVNFVSSVFNTANNKIVYIKNEMEVSLTVVITLAFLSFILLINNIFLFHKINYQKIQVLHLFGQNFWQINKPVLLFNGCILALNTVCFYIINRDFFTLFYGVIMIISEFIIIKITHRYLLQRNISSLLKEGR